MDPNRRPPATSGSGSSGDSSPASPSSSSGAPAGDKAATPGGNVFANDGSFMEMFKKKMEAEERRRKEQQEQQAGGAGDPRASEHGHTPVDKKPPPVTSFVGKRRGGVFLKTGMVAKKQKDESEVVPGKSDAWSSYMAEVKKYKSHQCGDDDKTRPLVK